MAGNVGIDIGNRILKFMDWQMELDLFVNRQQGYA